MDKFTPDAFLPLTPVAFEILLRRQGRIGTDGEAAHVPPADVVVFQNMQEALVWLARSIES